MKNFISILKNTKLFSGTDEHDIETMLSCLQAKRRHFRKGEYIFRQGDTVESICILLQGALMIQTDDYWGHRSIISSERPGAMFAEAYAHSDSGAIPNDVIALEDSDVVFFDVLRIMTTCSSACRFHTTTVRNLFFAISEKNRALVQKLGHMSKRSTREKLISYLSQQAKQSGSGSFTIPYNRQQLADFLSVDRSAMSNELSKMRNEGLLEFEKNNFRLL